MVIWNVYNGDDGEMQCAVCGGLTGCWDYKRTPVEDVIAAYQAAMKK